jgi:hypothetical protein
LFMLPDEVLGGWVMVQLFLLLLVGLGVYTAWRRQRRWMLYFASISLVAVILAIGAGSGWLSGHVPFFAGYREPQKFVALLAFGYAYFAWWGSLWLLERIRSLQLRAMGISLLALLIIAYTPTMLWGFYGQLRPVAYPADWFAANQRLNHIAGNGKVLFLPWHLYMSYGFAGRIIASPARQFFDKPMVASDDPEFSGVAPQMHDSLRETIQAQFLPAAQRGEPIAARLRSRGISAILLAKEYDYSQYAYLGHQPGLTLTWESPGMRLYLVEK